MSLAFLFSALIQFVLGLAIAWIIGPEAFGVHALGIAAAVIVQTLLFDWVRLGVTRYGAAAAPAFRFRLNRLMLAFAAVCILLAGLAYLAGGPFRAIHALVPLTALAAGVAEYIAAFQRARFEQRSYALLALFRAVFAILLSLAAALMYRTAEATMLAYALSILLATALSSVVSGKKPGGGSGTENVQLQSIAAYSWPIIITNLAYLGLFFALRALVARDYGLAASGQFSLALELGLKLVMTLGTALDVYLFQVAVRESASASPDMVKRRLRLNAEIVFVILAAALMGAWLVLPSVEVLVIAPEYRAAFAGFFVALLPGLLLYGMIQYALHPFCQIGAETVRLAIAALAGTGFALALMALPPLRIGTSPAIAMGVALFVAMLTAALVLLLRTGHPVEQALRLFAGIGAMLAAMALAAWPVHALAFTPGLASLFAIALAGGSAAFAVAWLLDLGRLRAILKNSALPPLM